MSQVTVAAIQMACSSDREDNLRRAEARVREAAAAGARVILLQELFETPYFCIDQSDRHFDLATSAEENPALARLQQVAAELGVVLPVSFFERAGPAFFNSLVMLDADGRRLGLYRKSHIPNGPGYQEKQFFSPGDTGFKVWSTRYGRIGVGICWDQWFPEAARVMALQGAELLLYPTAIGSEPQDASLDSRDHWQRVMQGHAAANMVPVVAANRIGREVSQVDANLAITFYGSSFICDETGAKVAEAGRGDEAMLLATFDLEALERRRRAWGLFRDRTPRHYGALLRLDGQMEHC